MDLELTDEQRAFAQAARDYAQGELAPHAAHWDAEGIFPREAFARAGEMGFCGIYASEEIGGLGLPRLDATLVFEEMAAVDPSTTAFLTIHNMATWMVGHWGQPALREEWGPQLASGEKLASYCLTEPGAGSDAASLSTRAQRQGADYIVNGAKAFISGGGDTNLLIVMARTGGEGAAGISAFAIPADSAGISYGRKEEKMGWNSQSTRPIVFENVRVPAANLLGNEGDGFKIAMKGLDGGRINIGTCSVGAAQGALDAARRYMDERRQFNRRPAEFRRCNSSWPTWPPISWPRARWCAGGVQAGRRRARRGHLLRHGQRFATDMGFQICLDAQQIHGGYGYLRDYPLSVWCAILAYIRFWRGRMRSCA